ncbi:hypothetical protein SMB34_01475 [Thalassospira permensis NBRC 106175]|uniref:Uncharacterized protein n=1 Tax=Thalassospira permensis NBRC 106175 TaxID=1353532 RepID=A0ABR4TVQ2_9PROT|nr:hypothetical protein SMB34_01475 [Thalassospira permensis NBRC 106175]
MCGLLKLVKAKLIFAHYVDMKTLGISKEL